MQLQQAETDLDATVNGVRNEIGLINSQRAVRNDILNRIDLPTAQSLRSEEHTSELQSPMRNSYAVFCLKKKKNKKKQPTSKQNKLQKTNTITKKELKNTNNTA